MKKEDFDKWVRADLPSEEAHKLTQHIMDDLLEYKLQSQLRQRLKTKRLRRAYFKRGLYFLALLALVLLVLIVALLGYKLWF